MLGFMVLGSLSSSHPGWYYSWNGDGVEGFAAVWAPWPHLPDAWHDIAHGHGYGPTGAELTLELL